MAGLLASTISSTSSRHDLLTDSFKGSALIISALSNSLSKRVCACSCVATSEQISLDNAEALKAIKDAPAIAATVDFTLNIDENPCCLCV